MSRFDDELRDATGRMADEPLPPDILDDALDSPPRAERWPALAAIAASAVVLVVAGGIAVGELTSRPSPTPSAGVSPTEGAEVAAPCEDIAPPAGGEDIVLVYFPCGAGSLDQASGVRSIAFDVPVFERLQAALRAVLDGPSALEQEAGMVGVVPTGSSALLRAIEAQENDGLAIVDFDPALARIENLSTSASGGAFIRSMRETALQFDEVTAVEFRLGGSCDAFFEVFQGVCQHVAEPVEEVSDCPIVPPAELPSGAPVTEPRSWPGQPLVSWGSGQDTVTEAPGHRDSAGLPDDGAPVLVRGYEGRVRPGGDFPRPLPMEITWVEEGCPYSVFVALSGGEDAVIEYAARFGPSLAQPSPPPAEPVTASVKEDGIRVTVTLDRDRTVFGQRVMATTTIENVGSDSVFWGHSGTCVYPSTVEAHPDVPARLDYGRDDWPGEEGILKMLTVDRRQFDEPLPFSFLPDSWLDSEANFACTTDFVVSEVLPGEILTDRRGWDTEGIYGMPPGPGAYTVDATFHYLTRGAPPVGDEPIDAFSVGVTIPIVVEGPAIDYVSPGIAVDAILADEAFRELLADAPRGLWNGQDLEYTDNTWEFALYLTASDREIDPVEAIVATVDARSGAVLGVVREPRTQPPGG